MPSYALSTTKRKFHNILDSIANGSTASLDANNNQHNASTTTLAPYLEPYAKKLKISRPLSTPTPPSSFRHARSTSSRTVTPRTSTASLMAEEKKPPNFAPWDRNQFLSRLETFRHVDKWMSKPDEINEVQWAKRGWTCVAKETVGCVGGCDRELVISLEPSRGEETPIEGLEPSEEAVEDYYDWRDEAQKELVKRYTDMIVTEHDEGCLWRRKGCDDSIHRIPLVQQATTLLSLRHRYESLTAISSSLPSNISTTPNLNISKLIPHLFHILHPTPSRPSTTEHPSSPTSSPPPESSKTFTPPTINPRAVTLALLGWQADTTAPIPGIAYCETCFRRLGLWLYKSPPASPAGSPPSSPTSSQPPPPSTPIITRLDPLSEHRAYCPWINVRSQTRNPVLTETDLPGWAILQNMVLNIRPPGGLHRGSNASVGNGGGGGGGGATGADGAGKVEEETRSMEERDKERWARLKRLKQVFRIKRKPKEGGDGKKA
ncbi:MAG: hypothetical protein LQ349_006900 [Xanthoria aureola]|nr:MAG: hypothetical protein LQ349_006900 [Xanthoria aureola]